MKIEVDPLAVLGVLLKNGGSISYQPGHPGSEFCDQELAVFVLKDACGRCCGEGVALDSAIERFILDAIGTPREY